MSHLSNQELVVIAGEPALVRRVVEAVGEAAIGRTAHGAPRATRLHGVTALHPVVAAGRSDRLQQAT